MSMKNNYKTLRIRLGGNCNLHCDFCHSNRENEHLIFNPNIIDYVLKGRFNHISYVGGETVLYMPIIVRIASMLPSNILHSYVTNGTIMSGKVLENTLKYHMRVGISINEFTYDKMDYDGLSKYIKSYGKINSACVYSGKYSLDDLDKMFEYVSKRVGYEIQPAYNVMHTTDINSNYKYTDKNIEEFIDGVYRRLDNAVRAYKYGKKTRYMKEFLVVSAWYNHKDNRCFRNNYEVISLDGKHMNCSFNNIRYDTKKELIQSLPKRNFNCSNCELSNKCMTCYLSVTDSECKIYNGIYRAYKAVLKRYGIQRENIMQYYAKYFNKT